MKQHPRVLIVDDIPTNVRLLEARLTAEYFDVRTASSGRDALTIMEEGQTDIVLLDVMMPEMDGFEVCQRIKADPRTAHIPVVMITALDQPSDRVKGLSAGADDFLTKPVDDVQLMARVKSLVRLKALTDELRARAQTGQDIAIEDAMRAMEEANSRPVATSRMRGPVQPCPRRSVPSAENDRTNSIFAGISRTRASVNSSRT